MGKLTATEALKRTTDAEKAEAFVRIAAMLGAAEEWDDGTVSSIADIVGELMPHPSVGVYSTLYQELAEEVDA